MTLSIDEYAQKFKMSPQMIRAKIRANRLQTAIDESGQTVILFTSQDRQPKEQLEIVQIYKDEIVELKQRIEHLEQKLERAGEQKEQMLRDERDLIERVYLSKDEQIKSFLDLIGNRLNGSTNLTSQHHLKKPKLELKHYLHQHHYTEDETKRVMERFAQAYGSDERILQHSGEFVLDFGRFNYNDLLLRASV